MIGPIVSTATVPLVADRRAPIRIAPDGVEAAGLWSDLGRLATLVLPEGWTLVGGLMVQLHAYEAGETGVRATTDIDILGDARQQAVIERIADALGRDGFVLESPSPGDRVSHRWRRGELIEDPSAMAGQLKGKEQSWLRRCDAQLSLDDPVLMAPFPRARVRRARLAYRLLVR